MDIEKTAIRDVLVLRPRRFGDSRGWFMETFNTRALAELTDVSFVQDNHSLSGPAGTIRGLHFQLHPHAQDKLIRVVRGRILDVALDLRRSSRTFGRHVAIDVSEENRRQVLIPKGFAHGFVTREPNTEVLYKVSSFYDLQSERGILWNDPALGIEWGLDADAAVLSEKDQRQPLLSEITELFA